jgi:hypothetical protein
MGLYSYKIPNLINGVSSQPIRYRLPNQADICRNFWPSVGTGLVRRPGTRYINTLSEEAFGGSTFVHTLDRTALEKYMVVIRPEGDLKVYNLITGEECSITNTVGNTDYVTVGNPVDNLRALTVGDQTFLLNREQTVELTGDLTPAEPTAALVWVKQVSSTGNYKITLKDSDGNSETHSVDVTALANINTQEIADELLDSINAGGNYTATMDGHVLYIKPDGRDVAEIYAEDPVAGTGLEAVFREADQISDLPAVAPQGFSVKVRGDQNRNQDDFYVTFETADGLEDETLARGSWVENTGWGIPYRMDPATLPHILENTGFNQFTYKQAEWGDRTVGDEETAEEPSFVGEVINGMTFWQNRLVMFSKDQVSMSETGAFFNFFPTTTLTIPDSERVDIQISVPRSGDILHALPYNDRLLLFTREIQFALFGDPVITPGNVSVYPVTYFPYDGSYSPQGLGRFVYFGSNRSEYFRTLEYFQETDGRTYDAVDVSEHASQFVPSGIQDLTVSSDLDSLCMTPEEEGGSLYFYKTFWKENKKVQSAWFDFEFPEVTNIVASKFVRNVLYLVLVRDGKTYLETLEFTDDDTEEGFPWSPYLDLRVSDGDVTETYDVIEDTTTITSDTFFKDNLEVTLVTSNKKVLKATTDGTNQVTFPGDLRDLTYFVGLPYDALYETPVLLLKPGDPPAPIDILKYVQVLSVRVNYEDSMEFTLELDGGSWGTQSKTLGVYRIGEEPVGSSWNFKDGHEEMISGVPADKLKVRLKSSGSFPMKPLSISYNVRTTANKELM